MLAQLSSIVGTYNDKKGRAAAQARELAKAEQERDAAAAAAAAARAKAEEERKKMPYQVLSKAAGISAERITLDNDDVVAFSQTILDEVCNLYQSEGVGLSYTSTDGSSSSLLVVPTISAEVEMDAGQSNALVGQFISALSKDGMSKADAIRYMYIQSSLGALQKQLLPPPSQVSCIYLHYSIYYCIVPYYHIIILPLQQLAIRPVTPTNDENDGTGAGNAADKKRKNYHQEQKSARNDIAATLVDGRKKAKMTDVDNLKWDERLHSEPHDNTTREDAKAIRAIIIAKSQCPLRAMRAMKAFLNAKNNTAIKQMLIANLGLLDDKSAQTNNIIVEGLRTCIHHHTNDSGCTRTTAAEILIKNVVTASVWAMDGYNINATAILGALGTTYNQFYQARKLSTDLILREAVVGEYQRATRSDYVREKVLKYVFDFALDDDYTRFDTKQSKVDVIHPVTGDEVSIHKRIWKVVQRVQQHRLFLESKHYKQFQEDNSGATIGYEIFSEARESVLRFVCNPLPESCVDTKVSNLDQSNTICKFINWRKTRMANMKVEKLHVGDIKAEAMVGDGAAKEIDGVMYLGKVESYDKSSQRWKIKYEADEDELDFVELCLAKQLYDANGSDSGYEGANDGGDGNNDALEMSQNNV